MKPSPSPDLESHLQRFVPEGALTYAPRRLRTAPLHLHIAPHRKTKRGDFRPGRTGEKHRITVNGTLNRFAFLITLLHEVAHARVWDQFGRRVKPHGPEWQAAFRTLLTQPLDAGVFPEDISKALERHITRPSASSCSMSTCCASWASTTPPLVKARWNPWPKVRYSPSRPGI